MKSCSEYMVAKRRRSQSSPETRFLIGDPIISVFIPKHTYIWEHHQVDSIGNYIETGKKGERDVPIIFNNNSIELNNRQ